MEGGFGYPQETQYHSHHGHFDVDVLAPPLKSSSSATGRPALQELAGGHAQYNNGLVLYSLGSDHHQYAGAYSPLMALQRLPDAPVLPTQALQPPAFGTGSLAYDTLQGEVPHQESNKQRLVEQNPLWLSPQFQAYRTRQKDKEIKQEQKWPDLLEAAYLDSLLLIPQMQRRKFEIDKGQRGRNELIGEYLWLAYITSLDPRERDVKKHESHPMYRGRKQISSHNQVLKNQFYNHRCFHFIFPSKEQKKEDRRTSGPAAGGECLKNNSVLGALKAGKMPKERPNYAYFKKILALHDMVVVRPKRNWIFVTNRNLTVNADGSGTLREPGQAACQDVPLKDWPWMKRELEREKWPREEHGMVQGALVHQFAKEFKQIESSSVNEVALDWAEDFPDLHARLERVMQAESDQTCDFLHMDVKLEMSGRNPFPAESSLNSCTEISVDKKLMLTNRWRVHTTLYIPEQLSKTNQALLLEKTYDMDVVKYHIKGCGNTGDGQGWDTCACAQKYKRDNIQVPFPAEAWASALQSCTDYPMHPEVERQEFEVKKEVKGKPAEIKMVSKLVRPPGLGQHNKDTQMDLVPRIAMMQEVEWAPLGSYHDSSKWTRRAVILWSFATIHSFVTKLTPAPTHVELVTSQPGTFWRFLTLLDPTSPEHLERALTSSPRDDMTRDVVMSPNPSYRQTLSASMSETLGSACYDAAAYHQYLHSHQSSYLDDTTAYCSPASSFSATSSYPPFPDAHHHDGADLTAAAYHQHHLAASSTATDLDSLAAVTDPFLTSGSFDGLPVGVAGWVDVPGAWPPAGPEHGHSSRHNPDDVLDWASPTQHQERVKSEAQNENEHEHADDALWDDRVQGPGPSQAQQHDDWVHVEAQNPEDWEVVELETNRHEPDDGDDDNDDHADHATVQSQAQQVSDRVGPDSHGLPASLASIVSESAPSSASTSTPTSISEPHGSTAGHVVQEDADSDADACPIPAIVGDDAPSPPSPTTGRGGGQKRARADSLDYPFSAVQKLARLEGAGFKGGQDW